MTLSGNDAGPAGERQSHPGTAEGPGPGQPEGSEERGDPAERSLLADVQALIDDGKTYLQAEASYQKTRAAFAADGAKTSAALFAAAALFGFLALIGLTVGLILSLAPIITPWGATAVVVGLLLVGAFSALRMGAKRWNRTMAAFQGRAGGNP